MNVLDSRYYATSKYFMGLIGLWPYESSIKRWTKQILYHVITLSLIVPMVLHLILRIDDLDIFIENLEHSLFLSVSMLKSFVSFLNANQLIILFSQIKKDWTAITDEDEVSILRLHAEKSRQISVFYAVYVFGAYSLYIGAPFGLLLLETFFPLNNGTYPLIIPLKNEYWFFDQLDYFYVSCLHALFGVFFPMCLYVGMDTIYLCTALHVAGLFEIVCHRFKNMFGTNDKKLRKDQLKKAVELYNESIRCCQLLEDSYSICIFIILILCAIGIAGFGTYISRIYNDLFILIRSILLMVGLIMQSLYVNWVGQQIIDSCEKVFYSVYFSDWYVQPPKIQKLINIVMSRTLHPHKLTAGKMIILSMYTFGKVMRSCTSIFAAFTYVERVF